MRARTSTTLFLTTWICVGMMMLTGCSHPLVIKNFDSYLAFGATNVERPLKVGIDTDSGESEHECSGWNFPINWPGFLIFTPAWHGYNYKGAYTIHCTLTNSRNTEAFHEFQIPIALDVRHAAINRTWTEIGWLEVSAIAFVGGLIFIDYDESATLLVIEKAEYPLGKYIAQEIVKGINDSDTFSRIDEKYSPDERRDWVDTDRRKPSRELAIDRRWSTILRLL